MKTASFDDTSVVLGAEATTGLVDRLLGAPRALARAMRQQVDAFAAIGLAEGGDTEGAAELLARSAKKS